MTAVELEPAWTHGTVYGYRKGCRCRPCVRAHYEAEQRWRAKAKAAPTPPMVHGTYNGYAIYGCRLECCLAVMRRDRQRQRAAQRRMRELAARGLPRDWEGDIPNDGQ